MTLFFTESVLGTVLGELLIESTSRLENVQLLDIYIQWRLALSGGTVGGNGAAT